MKHLLTCLLFHTLCSGFGQPGLILTEYMPDPGLPSSLASGEKYPWLELTNLGNQTIDAGSYKIRIAGIENNAVFQLKPQAIQPGQQVVFTFGPEGSDETHSLPFTIYTGNESIYLLQNDGRAVDSIILVNPIKSNEVWYRNILNDKWSIYPGHFASPGEFNTIQSNWNKIASSTPIPAADSEPNACLSYNGMIWILGGWALQPDNQTYASASYLWNSADGIHWNKISDSLPFTHYSGFTVFRDTIWVYSNYQIFSTVDGINWEIRGNVPYEFFGSTSRLTVLNDKLYFADTTLSGYSTNGVDFTFQEHKIPVRNNGSLKALNGKLFYFGGQNLQTGAYFNDVWTSEDGLEWKLVLQNAPWKPRKWFMSEVYQNKLWIFGGFNIPAGPFEGYANLNDIWFSDDGIQWHSYTPLNYFPIRHAAYHTLKDNRVFMIAGFDNGEINGLFNDVWTFEIKNYYLKPGGDVNNRHDWSSTRTFDGPEPLNFNEDFVHYHIGFSQKILLDKPFAISQPNATLVIGDGISETSVEMGPQSNFNLKTMVAQGSTLTLDNIQPEFQIIPQTNSNVVFTNCPKLSIPKAGYAHLSLFNVRILQSDTIGVNGHFHFHQLNLSGNHAPELTVHLAGTLILGEKTGTGFLKILGTYGGDQEIFTHNHHETKTGNLELIKPAGNFIVKDPLYIDSILKIRH